jgi:hypothetical protein
MYFVECEIKNTVVMGKIYCALCLMATPNEILKLGM